MQRVTQTRTYKMHSRNFKRDKNQSVLLKKKKKKTRIAYTTYGERGYPLGIFSAIGKLFRQDRNLLSLTRMDGYKPNGGAKEYLHNFDSLYYQSSICPKRANS
jgi:hypothetical protein